MAVRFYAFCPGHGLEVVCSTGSARKWQPTQSTEGSSRGFPEHDSEAGGSNTN